MNGVTILNTIQNSCDWSTLAGGIIAMLVGLIAVVAVIISIYASHDCFDAILWIFAIILLILALGMLFSGIWITIDGTHSDETTYEVTIDNTVGINDFMDKYEIVEQRGEIYVVKEIDK